MSIKQIQQGIYRIVNTQNGFSYIGRTTNFNKRFKEHADTLKNNRHTNQGLQGDYNKVTQDLFEYRILESMDNMSKSREKEWYYINKFESTGVYNVGNPLMEYNIVLDRNKTIFDSIPKEAVSEYSYQQIKDRTLAGVSWHMINMSKFSNLEKYGVVYWGFYDIFHEIHSQLFWYSTDARLLLALKEVLEEGGFQVVLSTYNSKKMSHFIPKDMKEYIVIKNETMNSIHYSFEKVLKIHEGVKKKKAERVHERKDEELKRLLNTIESKNKEIARLEKKFEKEKQKDRFLPRGTGSFVDTLRCRIQDKGILVEYIVSDLLRETGYVLFEDLIKVLIQAGLIEEEEINDSGTMEKFKAFLRVNLSIKINQWRISLKECKRLGVKLNKKELENDERTVIVYSANDFSK